MLSLLFLWALLMLWLRYDRLLLLWLRLRLGLDDIQCISGIPLIFLFLFLFFGEGVLELSIGVPLTGLYLV